MWKIVQGGLCAKLAENIQAEQAFPRATHCTKELPPTTANDEVRHEGFLSVEASDLV